MVNESFTAYYKFFLFLGTDMAQSHKGRVELYENLGS